jgi:dCMP deaminase
VANNECDKQYQKDLQFMRMARCVSERSKCSSRQVGAVLVKDGSTVGEGFNGSPRGSSLCQDRSKPCRRREMGFGSGEGLEFCVAIHAEQNCIIQAARNAISTKGTTLYCWCGRPCQKCMGIIINAGVSRLVFLEVEKEYDELSGELLAESGIQWSTVKAEDV